MARPLKEVDEALVYGLASDGCTYEEIGRETGIHYNTVARRYSELIKKGREHSKDSFLNRCLAAAFPKDHNGVVKNPNVGFAVLYSKLMGWYVERTETKNEDVHKVAEEISNKLVEAIRCIPKS